MAKGKIGKVLINLIAGANVTTILIMVIIGYSYYLDPQKFTFLSTIGLLFPIFIIINAFFMVLWFFFKKKFLLIPIAGFLLCAVPIRKYCPLNFEQEMPGGAIKVLSYNTHSYGGYRENEGGEHPVIDYIRECDADIACLQESAVASVSLDNVKKMLGIYEYLDTVHAPDGTVPDVALFSKFPILKKEYFQAENKTDGSAAFWVKMHEDTVIVLNCHLVSYQFTPQEKDKYRDMLKSIRDRDFEGDTVSQESKKIIKKLSAATVPRSNQARAIAEFLEKHKGESIIVCGDFNDNPLSYAHHTIGKNLTDCFVETGRGLGISFNEKGFYVRIDHIFCSKDWQPYGCKVDEDFTESDHNPIFCWLKKH